MTAAHLSATSVFYGLYLFNLATFLWDLYLSYRQYRVHRETPKRPEHVAEIISAEDYEKARVYKLDKHRFGFIRSILSHLETAITLFYNVLPLLYYWSVDVTARHYGQSDVFAAILYTITHSAISTILGLPLSFYDHFVVEEKHGFNKLTLRFFLVDNIKKFVVTSLITAPILAALIYIVNIGGPYFFFYVWIFLSIMTLAMMTIYPEFIAPLFDKYTSLPESELKKKIEALAANLQFPLTKLYVVEGSKRSAHSNAYLYGFYKNKRIVLFDTLLSPAMNDKLKRLRDASEGKESASDASKGAEDTKLISKEEREISANDASGTAQKSEAKAAAKGMSDDEVIAVLGHELGHWALYHVACMLVIMEVNLLFMLIVFSYFYKSDIVYAAFGFHTQPIVIGLLIVFNYVLAPYNEIVSVAISFVSRHNEFAADRFSAELGYAPLLRSALIKLSKDNLSMPIDDPLYSAINNSHPPVPERVAQLLKLERSGVAKKAQ